MDMLTFSKEQKKIIELAQRPLRPPPNPRFFSPSKTRGIIRVIAAAGSGKTTTLIEYVKQFIRFHPDSRITYVTFSKAAAEDARKRLEAVDDAKEQLDKNIQCRTIHSAIMAHFKEESTFSKPVELVDESKLDAEIMKRYKKEIDMFLSNVVLTTEMKKRRDPLLGLRKDVAFCIRKTLTQFLQSDKLLHEPWQTYYPLTKGKFPKLPRVYDDFYVKHAKHFYESIQDGSEGLLSYDMVVKKAQLELIRFPCDTLLVDEAQDCTACQIRLMWNQRGSTFNGTHVVLVGDTAQTIYGFRGAKSKNLMNIPHWCTTMRLTGSYRFGPEIAAVANTILFCKEFSPQTTAQKSWIPYRVNGVSGVNGSIMGPEDSFPYGEQYTLIARTNLSLFNFCLEYLVGKEPEVKVAINGKGKTSGRGKWLTILNEINDLFSLYNGNIDALKDWKLFEGHDVTSWDKFKNGVNDRELNRYMPHISLIETYKIDTLEKILSFEENILDKNYSQEEADVILTTVHAAKGMEWDNVKILDDFVELDRFKLGRFDDGEFALKNWGDDINLWYVAVTRARRNLSLPKKFIKLITSLRIILKYGESSRSDSVLEQINFHDMNSAGEISLARRKSENWEFNQLYRTLAIRYKEEVDKMDFNILDPWIDTSIPSPKKKHPMDKSYVEVLNETSDTKRIKKNGIV